MLFLDQGWSEASTKKWIIAMDYVISDGLAQLICSDTGMTKDDLSLSTAGKVTRSIEKKVKHVLCFGKEPGHVGRGSVLLQEDRIIHPEELASSLAL